MKLLDKIAATRGDGNGGLRPPPVPAPPPPAPLPPATRRDVVDPEREREHQRMVEALRSDAESRPRPFLPDPLRGEGKRDPRANVLADTIITVHLKEVSATRAEIDRLLGEADEAADDKTYRDLMIRVAATAQEIAATIDRVRLR